jgi:hypothetical protein
MDIFSRQLPFQAEADQMAPKLTAARTAAAKTD